MDYQEHNEKIEVPKSTGLDGFLHAIRAILKLPNVQKIEISGKGEVSYRFFTPKDAPVQELQMDFETLEPYAVIRNSRVMEFPTPSINAAVALCQLFALASDDKLHPCGFAGSPNSNVWAWMAESTSRSIVDRDALLGLPFWSDRLIEDETLILCAGFSRDAALIDTQKAYKLCIPKLPQVPNVL